ncbi:MAG: type VI secretion system tip protein TssI/VgrG [Pseudomonadota bacterium]
MTDWSQDASSLQLTTDLGDDALLLRSIEGTEALSAPFEFTFETSIADDDLDLPSLLGTQVSATLTGDEDNIREINGIVDAVRADEGSCTLSIRPWLSLLRYTSNNRIFQEKTSVEIISAVFDEAEFTDYRISTTQDPPTRTYCVQFGESDFAFVSRLLEEDGLAYFFEHEDGIHTLVIFDDVSECGVVADDDVPYLPLPPAVGYSEDTRIDSLAVKYAVTPDKVDSRDFNYITPSTQLDVSLGDGTRAVYTYPGLFEDTDGADRVAGLRLDAMNADRSLVVGKSPMRRMCAGFTLSMIHHPVAELNDYYLVRQVTHSARQGFYQNDFEAQLSGTPFRPPLVTPRPRIHGPQTAIVVGQSGEELWTDEHGRIKVQFHWDREGQNDENSSCWIRVAQLFAGPGWGTLFLPRIGQEVVVSFLNGDPDRPLVTGVVYNGERPPPYDLPAEQTKTTIKTESSLGGDGFNELRFEDKAGEEEIYIHAQLDMLVEVENDRTTTIGNDETVTVSQNRAITIEEGDESLTVSQGTRTIAVETGDETHSVAGAREITVTGDETRTNEANFTQDVTGDATLSIEGSLTISVSGDITIETTGALTLSSGGDMTLEAGGALNVSAGSTFTISGSASGEVDGGGALTVKGGTVAIN